MTNCDDCANYVFDDECECYVCEQNLDMDEMYRFLNGTFDNCPYFSSNDDYAIARKQ